VDTGENRPTTEGEASTEIMVRLPDLFLEEVSVFIKASKIFLFIVFFGQASYNYKN
jgi:hypothetical protein